MWNVTRTAASLVLRQARCGPAVAHHQLHALPCVQTRAMSFQKRKKKAMKQAAAKSRPRDTSAKMKVLNQEMQSTQHVELDSLGVVADHWVPIPSEHKASLFSLEGLKQRWEHLKKRARSTMSVGVIRRYDKSWKPVPFAKDVQSMLVDVQTLLSEASRSHVPLRLQDKLTAQALSAMKQQAQTPHVWEFVEEVERPRIVNVFTFPIDQKTNYYSQVTVRVHIKQRYAPVGKPLEERDVVDYVVLEKRIVAPNSKWRICSKIVPLFLLPPEEQARQVKEHEERLERQRKLQEKAKKLEDK